MVSFGNIKNERHSLLGKNFELNREIYLHNYNKRNNDGTEGGVRGHTLRQ